MHITFNFFNADVLFVLYGCFVYRFIKALYILFVKITQSPRNQHMSLVVGMGAVIT